MSDKPMCYKIEANNKHIEIHSEYFYKFIYSSSDLRFFKDPHFQQLWLDMLTKYQETFHEFARRIQEPLFIPIYKGHLLPLDEQSKLLDMIGKIQNENVGFIFFDFDFRNFKFKEPKLNQLLIDYRTNRIIEEHFIKNTHRIEPKNLENTIRKIECDTYETENPFESPFEFKQHIELLVKLYKNNENKYLTKTAYDIFLEILSKDFILLHELVIPHKSGDRYKTHDERPPYAELCQKYGKTEIDYLIHEYLLL